MRFINRIDNERKYENYCSKQRLNFCTLLREDCVFAHHAANTKHIILIICASKSSDNTCRTLLHFTGESPKYIIIWSEVIFSLQMQSCVWMKMTKWRIICHVITKRNWFRLFSVQNSILVEVTNTSALLHQSLLIGIKINKRH